jgi:hypothetical protein
MIRSRRTESGKSKGVLILKQHLSLVIEENHFNLDLIIQMGKMMKLLLKSSFPNVNVP